MKPRRTSTSFFSRAARKLWGRFFEEASWVSRFGSFREKESFGLIRRPHYAYGLLRAADLAKYFGKKATTVCEFGVANGDGLLNMVEVADQVERETGVELRIVGFDTGEGLPEVRGEKDHPELWSGGDFTMFNRSELESRIRGRAELVFGDIADTVDGFTASMDPAAPLGFVAIDVDLYSATVSALRCLLGRPESYSPALSMYFDDVSFFFANEWCGELAAIHEFNEAHEKRKIGIDRSLPGRRAKVLAPWYQSMYVAHILDHDARQRPGARQALTVKAHNDFMQSNFLY